MKVVKVASTMLDLGEDERNYALIDSGYRMQPFDLAEREEWVSHPDELAEAAGRLCYKSFDRPNPATASNSGYLANILKQKHFSVLEHASVTFYVSGVSRAMLLELERHRFLSFSVVSQRYVDHSSAQMVDHRILRQVGGALGADIREHLQSARELYERVVVDLEDHEYSRKEARGAARLVLLEGTETEFFCTGNIRAWREVIEKRNSPHADAEIREFAKLVLKELQSYCPNSVQDLVLDVEG